MKKDDPKNDLILLALVGFLAPLVLLYGMFFLFGFFKEGFSSLIYALIFFVSALLILTLRPVKLDALSEVQREMAAFAVVIFSLVYLLGILFSITGFFSI